MDNIKDIRPELTRIIAEKLKQEEANDKLIHYGGRVFDENEILNAIDALLDLWLTENKHAALLENEVKAYFDVPYCLLTNSGSSANLIIISALKSKNYKKNIGEGSCIATPALTFPTTVSPLYYNNLIPVYTDIERDTLNMDFDSLYKVSKKYPIKAVMLPHIMGNTSKMQSILGFCEENGIILIEDNCQAMGTIFDGRYAGTMGLAGSFSTYASHHITSGEGGIIITHDKELFDIMLSIRDWGRVNTEGHDAGMMDGHDLKYTYTELGFNLKQNDIFSAIGVIQFRKLDAFNRCRKKNYKELFDFFSLYPEYFIMPRSHDKTHPSWFGYPVILSNAAPFSIKEFKSHLLKHCIEARSLLSGNITMQPAFKDRPCFSDTLVNTDFIMKNSAFIGVYPKIGENELDYIKNTISVFVKNYNR